MWIDRDDVPDEAVDKEWHPCDNALTNPVMLEFFNSSSEDEEKFSCNYTRCTSQPQDLGCIFCLSSSTCTPDYAVVVTV